MTTHWKITLLAVIVLGVAAFVTRKTVTAAPQAAAPAKATEATTAGGALSIPDTTLAINSTTPMSQRIVHYKIDAKYNATKHAIDANEVLM